MKGYISDTRYKIDTMETQVRDLQRDIRLMQTELKSLEYKCRQASTGVVSHRSSRVQVEDANMMNKLALHRKKVRDSRKANFNGYSSIGSDEDVEYDFDEA